MATNPNASIRNGAEAIELAQRAVRFSGASEAAVLGSLAAAYAEARRFPRRSKPAEQALALATRQKNTALVDALRPRIDSIKPVPPTAKPNRHPSQPPATLNAVATESHHYPLSATSASSSSHDTAAVHFSRSSVRMI